MNHYPKHIGDWITATAHLNEVEECIYSRCIDKYYSRELPLPLDVNQVCRLVRANSKEAKNAVEIILNEFFYKKEDGWHQKRCDEEIEKYQDKSKKAKASASSRWVKPEQKNNANAMRTHNENNANAEKVNANALQTHCDDVEKNNANAMLTVNREPGTINQEPGTIKEKVKKENHFLPPSFFEVEKYCVERNNGIDAHRFLDFYTCRGWMVGKSKMRDWQAAVRTWEKNNFENKPPYPSGGVSPYEDLARDALRTKL